MATGWLQPLTFHLPVSGVWPSSSLVVLYSEKILYVTASFGFQHHRLTSSEALQAWSVARIEQESKSGGLRRLM